MFKSSEFMVVTQKFVFYHIKIELSTVIYCYCAILIL
jgi:hypothetical protein